MKAKWVYIAGAAFVLASWIGNFLYFRSGQLPQGGFLRHHLEVTDGGASFALLYAANREDRRKIVNVRVDEQPYLQFSPPMVHTETRHQTIYKIIGTYRLFDRAEQVPAEPLTIRSVRVDYSDGTTALEDVGEIQVFREPMPKEEERPVQFFSTSGSSDHTGTSTFTVTRPVRLDGVTSSWLPILGEAFQTEISGQSDKAAFPIDLPAGQSVTLSYRFKLPEDHPLHMDVFNLILRMPFREPDGREWTGQVFANYEPYPSEGEMRAYVRAKRREAP